MRADDLIISLAYFSIPTCWAVSMIRYSRTHVISSVPLDLMMLGILMCLFVLTCGIAHLLRALELGNTVGFQVANWINVVVSVVTAIFLIPMAPTLISKAEKSYQDLLELNEETAASKRKLFTFMNFLCHEIRNPLFAITSNIEFAQDMPMTHDLYESLTGINQSAQLMLRLVNDVLDLSKIESGKLQLEPQLFNLREFFQNMASTMDRQVRAKHQGQVQFVFSMAAEIPQMVQADSTRLLQICYNVLSNSNKFTELGAISFTIQLLQQDPSLKSSSEVSRNLNARENSDRDDSGPDLEQGDGMASLENFSFAALGGGVSSLNKSKHNNNNNNTGGSSSYSSLSRLQNKLIKSFPSASLRSLGSASDLSMDISDSAHPSNHGPSSKKNHHDNDDDPTTNNEEDDGFETVTLQLIFEDTGIGIEPEHLGRIFQPYTQSKLSDFRRHGGTGLGLSIIHKLLEMMEGTVNVTSKVGEGTKFIILLPIKVAKAPADEGAMDGQVGMDMEGNNISPKVTRRSYAKINDNPTMVELELDFDDEMERSEKDDHITPLSSASSHAAMVKRIRSAARSMASSNSSQDTGMSSESSCDQLIRDINGCEGAVDMTSFIPPDRDGAATPIAGNGAISRQYMRHRPMPNLPQMETQPLFSMSPSPQSDDEQDGVSGRLEPVLHPPAELPSINNTPSRDNRRRTHRLSGVSLGSMDASDATFQANNHSPKPIRAAAPQTTPPVLQVPQIRDDKEPRSSEAGDKPAPLFATTAKLNPPQPQRLSSGGGLFAIPPSASNSSTPDATQSASTQTKAAGGGLFSISPTQSTAPPESAAGGGGLFSLTTQSAAPPSAPSSAGGGGGLFSMTTQSAQPPAATSAGGGLFSMTTAPMTPPPPSKTIQLPVPAPKPTRPVPVPKSAAPPISAVPGQQRVRQLAKFNFPKNTNMVLLVDDNGVNRKLLGKMLTYFNLQYQDAEHGKQAVEIMERSQNVTGDASAPQFGLVLMDLCMPVMDGYEAIRQLRNKLNLHDVPVIALTASAMEDEKQKAMAAGATEFATKPLLRPALHKKCLEYLKTPEQEQKPPEAP